MKQPFHLKSSVNINGYLCHVTQLMTSSRSFQRTSERKMSFHAFGQRFQPFTDTPLQKPENMLNISKLPINENRIEKLLVVRFLLLLLFRPIVEKLRILFGPHCNISAYTQDQELKFSIQMNFDTLISNLKSYFKYEIVMTSL